MKDRYKTLAKTANTEIIIKKSRFITSVSPVASEEEAIDFISRVKKEQSQANHNVYAYIINEQTQRYSDDGEPGGTAGRPVLDVIKRKDIVKAAVVVTRYFGGILLGAGGLVRAYSEAAVNGIEAAGIVEKLLYRGLYLSMDYPWLGVVKREVENAGGRSVSIDYGQRVQINAFFRPAVVEALTTKITEITAAQVIIQLGDFVYI